jgi:tRNA-splicing ligase RtcB (3'-phosphate/5'-hydroxy nucleic acid ligase)
MITMKGKYNIANIMLEDETLLDKTTKEQIQSFLNNPVFGQTYISIMPDCHAGAGSCIGFTMKMNDYIIPNIVGVDIGCGVTSVCIGKTKIDLKKLDNIIKENIPSGFNVRTRLFSIHQVNENIYSEIKEISNIINSNANRNCLSLGSLGGGNHFIELGKDQNNKLWLTVHSGSRKFGLDIATYHQNKAKKLMKKMFLDEKFKGFEFLVLDNNGEEYIKHMKIAQSYAYLNRELIIEEILKSLNISLNVMDTIINSTHNYISEKDDIIRKGAVSAYDNEQLVIPFNMEDGLIIGTGKSNKKWNYSAPHGAGRVLSRTQAKKQLNLEEAKQSMENAGIYTTSLNNNSLDEVKKAYKNKDMILESIKETVDIEYYVKPIYNFKDS